MTQSEAVMPDPGAPGDVSVFFENGKTVILLRGNIDLSVADDLEHAGRDAIDAALPIHADCRAIDTIDSVGISFLIRLAGNARAADTEVWLLGPAPRVSELLTLLEADDLFHWIDSPTAS